MEARLRHTRHVVVWAIVLAGVFVVASSTLAETPVPQPMATCVASEQGFFQTTCITENVTNATLQANGGAQNLATPASQQPAPSTRAITKAAGPQPAPPPFCGYVALNAAELGSPGVWAGAREADTGTLRPGHFPTAPVTYYGGAVPDSMKGLGVVPYWYDCNGHKTLVYGQTFTPGPSTPGRPAQAGRLTAPQAQQLQGEIQVPGIGIGLNPDQAGITGLASYFWITGYDGAPVYRAATGSAGTGYLPATPLSYQWSFGDGTSVTTTSTGQAYPKASDIAHTYDVRSDRSPMAGPQGLYHVSVTASFAVAFQVSVPGQTLVPNGTWQEFSAYGLPPLQATVGHDYKVNEIRQFLTG